MRELIKEELKLVIGGNINNFWESRVTKDYIQGSCSNNKFDFVIRKETTHKTSNANVSWTIGVIHSKIKDIIF